MGGDPRPHYTSHEFLKIKENCPRRVTKGHEEEAEIRCRGDLGICGFLIYNFCFSSSSLRAPSWTILFSSHNLLNLEVCDRSWIKIDALLEYPREPGSVEGDDPALLDDHLFDDPPIGQSRAADGEVFALGNALGNQHLPPFLWQNLGEPIARRNF